MALGCGPAKTGHGLHPHLPSQFDSLRWARVIGRPVLTWLLLLFFPFRNRFRNKVSPRYRRPIRVSRSSLFHTQPPRPWPSSCPTCRPSEKRATYLSFFSHSQPKKGHKQPAKPLAFGGGRIASTVARIDPGANVCGASFMTLRRHRPASQLVCIPRIFLSNV